MKDRQWIKSFRTLLMVPFFFIVIIFAGFLGNKPAYSFELPDSEYSDYARSFEKGETPFRFGALDIFPGFNASVIFDDNIFLTSRSEESDTILRYTPSIAFNLPFAAASNAAAVVTYDIFDFSDNGNEDTENLIATGILNLERIFGKYYLRTKGGWADTSESSDSEEESAIGLRRDRKIWGVDTAAGFGGYEGNTIRLEVNGGYSEERFDRRVDERLDEDIWRVGALGEYRISPLTAIRVETGFERSEFPNRLATDSDDDSDSYFVRGGVAFSSGALITGSATFGVEVQEFDSSPGRGSREDTGFSADVDLTWRAVPDRTTVRGRFGSSLETASSAGEFGFREYRGEIGVSQGLFFISPRLTADAVYSYERNDFLRSSRADTIQEVSASLLYRREVFNMPLFGRVRYQYRRRSSNVNVNDYTNNIVTITVGVQY